MNFAVINLGCKVNRVESDDVAALLRAHGVETGEEDADLVVVNTCTVTGEAEKKTRNKDEKDKTHNHSHYEHHKNVVFNKAESCRQ